MCSALILSPTRELAAQIVENIKNYSKFTKISVALIVGGVRPGSQIKMLNAGVDIVVATPGRLLDHMSTGAIFLAKTQSIVIDEADQMLDLGFLPDIRKIIDRLPRIRQTALLSATMPAQIRKLADDFLSNPAEIKVAAVSRPVERIVQSVLHVAKTEKRDMLAEILSDTNVERTIVFTRTKRGADRVCKNLKASNLPAAAIHGDKSQGQRDRTMAEFRCGKTSILVATDIAARGIDIDDISHVVNFELPNVPEAYVHRIGRTARAGKSGTAISLCDPSERILLRDIEKLIGSQLRSETRSSQCPTTSTPRVPQVKRTGSARTGTSRNSVQKEATHFVQASRSARKHGKPRFKKSGPDQPLDGLMRMFSNIGDSTSKSPA